VTLNLTDGEERALSPPLLTRTITDDRYPLPPPTAFATGILDPISGP
jgi:hypothetical protein